MLGMCTTGGCSASRVLPVAGRRPQQDAAPHELVMLQDRESRAWTPPRDGEQLLLRACGTALVARGDVVGADSVRWKRGTREAGTPHRYHVDTMFDDGWVLRSALLLISGWVEPPHPRTRLPGFYEREYRGLHVEESRVSFKLITSTPISVTGTAHAHIRCSIQLRTKVQSYIRNLT